MAEGTRFGEIDSARGIAILMMVLFHTMFDLSFFSIAPVNVASGFWRIFAYATATLFLLVVGISLVVSHARAISKLGGFLLAKKYFVRGAGIFALGMLVTVATYLYIPQGFILFGILHLIGVSVMLSPLFFRFGRGNIAIGTACIMTGWIIIPLAQFDSAPLFLLPLGIHGASFWSVDYTPLFPWFGVVLIGMGLGEFLYGGGQRHFTPPRLPGILESSLSFLGRHSLLIYLVHQPIIILILAAITGTSIL